MIPVSQLLKILVIKIPRSQLKSKILSTQCLKTLLKVNSIYEPLHMKTLRKLVTNLKNFPIIKPPDQNVYSYRTHKIISIIPNPPTFDLQNFYHWNCMSFLHHFSKSINMNNISKIQSQK